MPLKDLLGAKAELHQPLLFRNRLNKIESHLSRDITKLKKMSVRPAKTQISLGIRPVLSESSLCAQWITKDPSFPHADSEDFDQTGRMPRLILVFAGRTLTLLALSCRGSNRVSFRMISLL